MLGGSGRAKQVWRALLRGDDPFAPGALSERARLKLVGRCRPTSAALGKQTVADDGTLKALVELEDGNAIEMVVIPKNGRTTVCVSTQVGCKRACSFCVTALVGLRRSLSAAEIVFQVELARRMSQERKMPPLRNVVFMGMGEPLDNLDAVKQGVAVLCDQNGLSIPPRHITLSTVGTTPTKIWSLKDLPVSVAWSLHTADDELRHKLVPTMRHALIDLRDAFVRVVQNRNALLFVEMALIAGINDDIQSAEKLADFLVPFGDNVRINLLPLNPGRGDLAPSQPESVGAYRQTLIERGYFCILRQPRGLGANAACGQLAGLGT